MNEDGSRYSRRDVLKRGAIATGAVVLGGTAGSGTAAASIGDGRVLDYHLNNINYDREKGEIVSNFVHDASPADNDGLWSGDDDPIVNGAVGNAFEFDGEVDEVSVSDIEELRPGSSSWSVAFWAKPANVSQDTAVVSKRQPSSPFPMYLVGFAGSAFGPTAGGKKFAFRYTEEARNIDRGVHTTDDIVDGKWHHCAAVADKPADELKLFVDGTERTVNTEFDSGSWPDITNEDDLYLGQDNEGGRRYDGVLDEVRVYNRPLSSEEVTDLYEMRD